MELLQVFDDDKNMLDEYIERSNKKELPNGKYFMIILLWLQNSEEKFLIQKVSETKGSVYATTGGHVTFKDNNIVTVIKEAYEELGINLSENDLTLVSSNKVNCCFVDNFYCKKNIDIESLRLQEEEVESVTWLSIEEIEDLIKNDEFRKGNISAFNEIKCYLKNEME